MRIIHRKSGQVIIGDRVPPEDTVQRTDEYEDSLSETWQLVPQEWVNTPASKHADSVIVRPSARTALSVHLAT
jgi:hypothetical protein